MSSGQLINQIAWVRALRGNLEEGVTKKLRSALEHIPGLEYLVVTWRR